MSASPTALIPLVEPIAVQDVFATGLHDVENVGGCWRFTIYSRQTSVTDGSAENVVVARIVLPSLSVLQALRLTVRAICCGGLAPCCRAGADRIGLH